MSKTTQKPITLEAFENAVQGWVKNNAALDLIVSNQVTETEKVRLKFDEKKKAPALEMEAQYLIIEQYCKQNKCQLFEKAKTLTKFGAKIGFVDGKESVVVKEGYEEKAVIAAMSAKKPLKIYLRTKLELDKVAIKNMWSKLTSAVKKGLEDAGVTVSKGEETFFVKAVEQK